MRVTLSHRSGLARKIALGAVRLALAALLLASPAGPPAAAQTISSVPARPSESATVFAWTIEHVEAPTEIAFETMAVRLWARVRRSDGTPVTGATLVLRDADERIPMQPLDGAFDSSVEDAVATVDTYTWVRTASHVWEMWGRTADGAPSLLTSGAIRVKPRVSTPDLVLVDEFGRVTPWIGSGAGGFVAGNGVDCGDPLGAPEVLDVNGDHHFEVLMSARDGGIHVLKSARTGRLAADRLISCGFGLAAAALGDLDGDGGVDLVTAMTPRLLEIRRDLEDVATQTEDLPLEAEHLALADLDGDGLFEIYLGLLGLDREEIVRWAPSDRKVVGKPREWVPDGVLSPSNERIGRLRFLAPLNADGGRARALLAVSAADGQAVLESWGGAADIESVDHSSAPRLNAIAGEPLGVVSGRFSDASGPSWLVWVQRDDRVEWVEVPVSGPPVRRGGLGAVPAAVVALDLDGDGDDDLATGGEELRLWINVRGGAFREAGDSPYPLEAAAVALATGRLDE